MSLIRNCISRAVKHSSLFNTPQPCSVLRRNNSSYEGIGRTYTEIINQSDPYQQNPKMVEAYSTVGFRLTDGTFAFGPILIFQNEVFCWNVKGDEEINAASMEFMFHLHPPLDLIVIGYSDEEEKEVHGRNLHVLARKHNIGLELLYVEKAVGTFNFLVGMRNVAGAFIPPRRYTISGTDAAVQNMEDYLTIDEQPCYAEELYRGTLPEIPKYTRVKRQKEITAKSIHSLEAGGEHSKEDNEKPLKEADGNPVKEDDGKPSKR